MGFFGKFQSSPVTIADGKLARVLLDSLGRVQVSVTGGFVVTHDTIGYQSRTVSSTAVSLSPTSGAIRAVISVEDADVRFRSDGDAPTTSEGHILFINDIVILESAADLASFQAIRDGAVDATLKVSYQS